ncbi:ABC transporter ATP-binding protein [Marinomonas profundimaris]|uniref:Hydrogenase expression protein n=1 Tax=Marinomonas profundimaris TaxID=1208321 RepID=W1RYD3_9GAMM|nr:ABC transporter ATP-binding protein [Marinomonas profundimaris]ETI62226.1 hydrogenase expression protein [Marinomonas profundimaris]
MPDNVLSFPMSGLSNTSVSISITEGYLRYFNSQMPTLMDLNVFIPAGKWTCILGRSGCGKTSLLRYLAGLLDQRVNWSGKLRIDPAQAELKDQVAYMAQQDLLMPWLSVLDNVLLSTRFGESAKTGFSVKNTHKARDQKEQALTLLEKVGLADNAHQLPQQLSGGMRQRVALARTLMQNKPVVLMDEPFSALDAVTRYRLQDLACTLLKDKTVVLITHDPQEAFRLAHQIYLLRGSPSTAELLTTLLSSTPRVFDATGAQLQQRIMERLEYDDDE